MDTWPIDEIASIPDGEKLFNCIQCGTCSAACPVSPYMDYTPRKVVAMIREGFKKEVLSSTTPWLCASCYACTVDCPKGIKITDIIYALKRTAMEKNSLSTAPQVQRLGRIFTRILMKYGRLHEGTLIRKYYTRTNPWKFLDLIPLARKMWAGKRVELFPRRIRAHASLSRIIQKAQEIVMRHVQEAPDYALGYVGYRGLGDLKLEQRQGE